MKSLEEIDQSLNQAYKKYQQDCKNVPKGWAGSKREKEFLLLKNTLHKSKNLIPDLMALSLFVIEQSPTSRLRNYLMNALFDIFELELPEISAAQLYQSRGAGASYTLAHTSKDNRFSEEKEKQALRVVIKEKLVRQAIENLGLKIKEEKRILKEISKARIFSTSNTTISGLEEIVAKYAVEAPELRRVSQEINKARIFSKSGAVIPGLAELVAEYAVEALEPESINVSLLSKK